MEDFFDPVEPNDEGTLPVGDGHTIYWTQSGSPTGKPLVILHGGPGSGASPRHRRIFDPERYRIIQFDQRSCGRSTPYAGDPIVDLAANTTGHLIGDVERLRTHLAVDRWMVWGGSWGTTLGLAYAQAHPESVTELMLAAVCSTNSVDVDWTTRAVGRVLPEAWQRFRDHLPPDRRHGNLPAAYHELLMDPDPDVHDAAALAWCRWEDRHMAVAGDFQPGLEEADPEFRLCFARLVTHFWGNAAFMPDDQLLDNAHRLTGFPVFLTHGRLDISSPMDFPFRMAAAITEAGGQVDFFVGTDDGHAGSSMNEWGLAIANRLAAESR